MKIPLVVLDRFRTLAFAPDVNSGEEFDYRYVVAGGTYNFNSFDKRGMFVLPPKPQIGDVVYFSDKEGSTRFFPTVIHRNGNAIMGEVEHMNCDIPHINFKMKFVGGKLGWHVETDLRFIQGARRR